jgi:hemoglobin
MNATPTLYEWAGGEAAIRRLMDCFYDRVERDELLSRRADVGVLDAQIAGDDFCVSRIAAFSA